jgi:hypothetical protein
VWSGRSLPTFQRSLLPPSSGRCDCTAQQPRRPAIFFITNSSSVNICGSTILSAVQTIWRRMIEWVMNCKGYGRKRSWPFLRYCPGIYLEGLRKRMIT